LFLKKQYFITPYQKNSSWRGLCTYFPYQILVQNIFLDFYIILNSTFKANVIVELNFWCLMPNIVYSKKSIDFLMICSISMLEYFSFFYDSLFQYQDKVVIMFFSNYFEFWHCFENFVVDPAKLFKDEVIFCSFLKLLSFLFSFFKYNSYLC